MYIHIFYFILFSSHYLGDEMLVAEIEELLKDTDLMQRTVNANPGTDVSNGVTMQLTTVLFFISCSETSSCPV